MFFRFLFILTVLLLSFGGQAQARDFTPTSQIVDYAGVLDSQTVGTLKYQIENLEYISGQQIVILVVPSLQGRTPENYATWIIGNWGIGQKTKGAALLLVARDEKKAWLETVGTGMELLNRSAKKTIVAAIETALQKGGVQSAVNDGAAQIFSALSNKAPARLMPVTSKIQWLQVAGLAFVIILRVYFFGFRRRSLLGHLTDGLLGGARRRW